MSATIWYPGCTPSEGTLDEIISLLVSPQIYGGTWAQGCTYAAGTIVEYNGNFYKLLNTVTNAQIVPPSDPTNYAPYSLLQGSFVNVTPISVAVTAGQTVVVTPIPYVMGTGRLLVYINGIYQTQGYTETTTTSITFDTPLPDGVVQLLQFTITGNGTDAASIAYTAPFTGATSRTQASKDADFVTSYDFMSAAQIADVTSGAPTGDYTTILQNLFNVKTKPVYVLPGIYPISGPLFRGTSTIDRAVPIYMEPGAVIIPSGVGYTALTIYPLFFTSGWNIRIESGATTLAGRPTLHGCYIFNSGGCHWKSILVNGFNGFGLKVDQMWDSICDTISVQLSGNATNYAFSMNSAGDTSNETHIARLQVELSDTSAIYFDPLNINVRVSNIHSERTYANSASQTYAWDFGGVNCYFGNMNLTSLLTSGHDGIANMAFRGNYTTYENGYMQGSAGSPIATYLAVNAGSIVMKDITTSSFGIGAGHNSPVSFYDCHAIVSAALIDTPGNFWKGGTIAALTMSPYGGPGYIKGDETQCVFENAIVGTVTKSATPAFSFKNCTLTGAVGIGGIVQYESCKFSVNMGFDVSPYFKAINSTFDGNVSFNFSLGQGELINCTIVGNLTNVTVGSHNGLVNVNSTVSGTVDASLNTVPDVGIWPIGKRNYRLTPVVGQPKSWVCTVAGTPGTWVSEGNL